MTGSTDTDEGQPLREVVSVEREHVDEQIDDHDFATEEVDVPLYAEETGGVAGPGTEEDPTPVLNEQDAPAARRRLLGHVRFRRHAERTRVRDVYPRQFERVVQERIPVGEGDSGQIETLPDGSISIPLYEEQLVVTRKVVLRERIIVSKELVPDAQAVEGDVRRERVRLDAGGAPAGSVEGAGALLDAETAVRRHGWLSETKPFFLTSEFLVSVLAVLGLLVTTLASDVFDGWRFWLAAVVVAASYVLARGSANSGGDY